MASPLYTIISAGSETKEVPVYALVTAKNGPNLQEAKPGDTYPNGFKDPHGRPVGAGTLTSISTEAVCDFNSGPNCSGKTVKTESPRSMKGA